MITPALDIQRLRHDYGQGTVLDLRGVHLAPGAYHVTGANGAGKTTLLAILATLLPPSKAQLRVLGRDPLTQGPQLRARIGYAAHDPSLHPQFTVEEALALHARLHGQPPSAVVRSAEAWALTALRGHRIARLSHGQARRVDLARATLHQPDLLLLDEPTAGLDEQSLELLAPHLTPAGRGTVLTAGPGGPPRPGMTVLWLRDGQLAPAIEDSNAEGYPP